MLRNIELAFATFALIILTGTNAYYFLMGIPSGITQEEMGVYEAQIRNVFMLAYVVVAALAVIHWQKMILGMLAVWPIMVLLAIAWASKMWTVDAAITHQRCIALSVTTLMGIYLFVRFDFEGMLKFLTVAVGIIAFGCILWAIGVPEYGVHSDAEHAGAWKGIFFHKNATGRVMVFGLAVVIAAWIGTDMSRGLLMFIGGATLLVALATTSQTTLLGLIVLGAGMLTVRMVRGEALTSVLVTLVVLTIAWHGALLLFATYDVILELMGRDPSLTGRTDIWLYVLQYISNRPFTGYGYDAFWNGDLSPGTQYSEYWGTPHSHNGWLQVAIGIGLPAALIIFGIFVVTVGRAIFLARYHPSMAPATFIVLACFTLLTTAMSESVFMERHTFDWMLMIAVVGCARALTSSLGKEAEAELPQAFAMDQQAMDYQHAPLSNLRPRPAPSRMRRSPVS